MDKAIVFTIVALLVYALPRRTTLQFAFVRRFRVLAGKGQEAAGRLIPCRPHFAAEPPHRLGRGRPPRHHDGGVQLGRSLAVA